MRLIYFDMDGVVADFDGHYTMLTGKSWSQRTDETSHTKWANVRANPTFFLDLPWVTGAQAILKYCMSSRYVVGICSAASPYCPESHDQKIEWLARETPEIETENIVIVSNADHKRQYARPGFILVDDKASNIDQWREAGGIGILFLNASQALVELHAVIQGEAEAFQTALIEISESLS